MENMRNNQEMGAESDTKVAIMREFKNSEANHLGMPLPKGRVRFYKQDNDKQLEFTGENMIDHTPKDETVRIYTGNAFDLVGERRRTNFKVEFKNIGSTNRSKSNCAITRRNRSRSASSSISFAGSLGTSPKNPTRFKRPTRRRWSSASS